MSIVKLIKKYKISPQIKKLVRIGDKFYCLTKYAFSVYDELFEIEDEVNLCDYNIIDFYFDNMYIYLIDYDTKYINTTIYYIDINKNDIGEFNFMFKVNKHIFFIQGNDCVYMWLLNSIYRIKEVGLIYLTTHWLQDKFNTVKMDGSRSMGIFEKAIQSRISSLYDISRMIMYDENIYIVQDCQIVCYNTNLQILKHSSPILFVAMNISYNFIFTTTNSLAVYLKNGQLFVYKVFRLPARRMFMYKNLLVIMFDIEFYIFDQNLKSLFYKFECLKIETVLVEADRFFLCYEMGLIEEYA